MYSGFITSRRAVAAVGVHQRFDTAAYKTILPFITPGTFPDAKQIIHFEGLNGPDGLKVKSPGEGETSHLYDPETGRGEIPELIQAHYNRLVCELKTGDLVRSGFEAAWLAHYVCDGLTPAHHFPLDEKIAEQGATKTKRGGYRVVDATTPVEAMRKSWALIGSKGLLTTHFNFEMGVATAIAGQRLKVKLDHAELTKAHRLGPVDYFKRQAQDVARMEMFESFYRTGWSPKLARQVKIKLAPQIVHTLGVIWLLAYLEAGQQLVVEAKK